MTGQEAFLEDLANLLRDDLKLVEPQGEDEITVRWFSENVLHDGRYNIGRACLEKMVKEGLVTVRRHVKLTWGRGPGRSYYADVYRRVNGKAEEPKAGKSGGKKKVPRVRIPVKKPAKVQE